MSREYTKEEVKEQFLNHVRMLIEYWDKESAKETQTERLEGLAFSILSAIDGESASLPQFVLAPLVYYPENPIECNISGDLHDSL